MTHYDYFVIGGGSGGVRSARIAASHGAKVGLAERSFLGGTCVNVGCVPKKLFSYAADYGFALEDMKGFGWKTKDARLDWETLIKNKDTEIHRLHGIYQKVLETAGVEIFHGHAKFLDTNTLTLNGHQITADKILIATGGKPRKPKFLGAEHTLVSDDMFSLETLPEHIVIQGGGYIAVEFAHIFHGLGVNVTLLYRGSQWMRGFDSDISTFLRDEYIKQGIDVRFNTDIESILKKNRNCSVLTTDSQTIECGLVLSAIGRIPNLENLGVEDIGIELEKNGQIRVNKDRQTSIPHIYALGDVSNKWNLTPYAIAEGHLLADRLFGKGNIRDVNLELIPTAVFSNPPIATVGLSEEDAIEKKLDIKAYITSFKPLRHTLSGRDEKTMMKLIVERKSNKILGCHMIGTDTPEMLQGIAIALNAGATKNDFDRTLGIHPTSAEELVTMK